MRTYKGMTEELRERFYGHALQTVLNMMDEITILSDALRVDGITPIIKEVRALLDATTGDSLRKAFDRFVALKNPSENAMRDEVARACRQLKERGWTLEKVNPGVTDSFDFMDERLVFAFRLASTYNHCVTLLQGLPEAFFTNFGYPDNFPALTAFNALQNDPDIPMDPLRKLMALMSQGVTNPGNIRHELMADQDPEED